VDNIEEEEEEAWRVIGEGGGGRGSR